MGDSRGKFILSVAFVFLLALPHPGWSVPTVSLEVLDPGIEVGGTFDVDVLVSDLDPFDEILAFGFDVSADTGLSYNGAVVGLDFFDDSALWFNTDVAGSAFPGATGDPILLATLSFTPTVTGTLTLGIESDPFGPDFGLSEGLITLMDFVPYDLTTSLDVTVSEATPVPEPSTLILLGIGFASLLGIRVTVNKKTC